MPPGPVLPLPLDLVTGFLGSGKTTLINAVLQDRSFAGAMVIVNEFGETGLDHLLISTAQDNVVLLDSGCLCCASSGTLRDTLIDLFSRRASGALPPFTRIIVETSGLADPAPIVASLLGDSALTPRCTLSQVLTLVDASRGPHTLERYREAQRQVAFADRLVISKVDTASPAQIDSLTAELSLLNPNAPVERWQQGHSPLALFAPLPPRAAGSALRPGALRVLRGPLLPQYGCDEADSDEPNATHGRAYRQIRTHVLEAPDPVSWPAYAAWTGSLRTTFGNRLLRCKGILQIEPGGEFWVVQGVQGYFAPPRPLGGTHHNLSGFLVCIGEAMTRADLIEALGWPADPLVMDRVAAPQLFKEKQEPTP